MHLSALMPATAVVVPNKPRVHLGLRCQLGFDLIVSKLWTSMDLDRCGLVEIHSPIPQIHIPVPTEFLFF